MIELDAQGLFCPEPLMMVQKAMKEHPGEAIRVVVDSAAPRDNISRMVRRKNRALSVEEGEGIWTLSID